MTAPQSSSPVDSPSTPDGAPQDATQVPVRSEALTQAMRKRVVIADSTMGRQLQDAAPTLDDFQWLEGCNEMLNVSRPDLSWQMHDSYLETGARIAR